ncbi:CrcB family protein [Phycicoccus sp. MAQZ13P-2]|uniref:fluoride efflux transporter FluC n=1 Tax=Phycicoccus mangrovi TaxID=2840470 RepID=UPI001C0085CE|nr:CrcB family protein [Phycicoccus mangrovi]MBT9256234.1 CrcB family protein [Phycicoccus mangrovi]MBT9273751.1 CrcB family protein [Phycicoccus mangrovi]
MTATHALLVALGAAVGAPLRLVVAHYARERLGAAPPAGTLTVNVVGSLVLGVLVGDAVGGSALALVGTGFCGALTTFSTLALELWEALDDDRPVAAAATLGLSLVLGLGAAALGYALAA